MLIRFVLKCCHVLYQENKRVHPQCSSTHFLMPSRVFTHTVFHAILSVHLHCSQWSECYLQENADDDDWEWSSWRWRCWICGQRWKMTMIQQPSPSQRAFAAACPLLWPSLWQGMGWARPVTSKYVPLYVPSTFQAFHHTTAHTALGPLLYVMIRSMSPCCPVLFGDCRNYGQQLPTPKVLVMIRVNTFCF